MDSGKVSSSLICIGFHPSVDYITFDFLHKVDQHELKFQVQLDGWVDFIIYDLKRDELNCWYFIPGVSSQGRRKTVSQFFPEC